MKQALHLVMCFVLATTGCASSHLLRQNDYAATASFLGSGQADRARIAFPNNSESGGFITTIEQGYLDWLQGIADPKALVKISDQLQSRETILLSREAQQFFYQETEDGYYPAEHEIIWLNLIAGMQFAHQGNRQGARVEAQRAANRLQGHEDSVTGDFDDAILRIWLAGLWIYCGEWEHARVDLRNAARLNAELKWAGELAEKDQPPRHLFFVLEGSGPEPQWRPETFGAHLTGQDSLHFPLKLNPSYHLEIRDAQNHTEQIPISLSSAKWYERHQQRNTAIRETLVKSKYMVKTGAVETKAVAGKSVAATVTGFGYLLAGAIIVGAAALVVGIVYALSGSAGGDVSGLGDLLGGILVAGVGTAGVVASDSTAFYKTQAKEINADRDESLNIAKTYRFVRFIPDWVSVAASQSASATLTDSFGLPFKPFEVLKSPNQRSELSLYFLP